MQNKLFLKAADICELLEVKQTSAYEIILCMFESCDTEEFTEILGKLLGGKQTSKVTAHLEALEELLTEEEYSSFLAEYLGYLTVNVAEFIRSTIIENGLMLLAGTGGEEDGEDGL